MEMSRCMHERRMVALKGQADDVRCFRCDLFAVDGAITKDASGGSDVDDAACHRRWCWHDQRRKKRLRM